VALAVAGVQPCRHGGLRLPIETCCRIVSEGEAAHPPSDHFGAGHFYISQSDKGGLVFGGDIDGYNSYAQRGNLPTAEDVCEGGMAIMPMIGRLRIVRSWGGLMDMSMDGSPIIDRTPIGNIYLNAGWCYGGFKATRIGFSRDLIARRAASARRRISTRPIATGRLIDERRGRTAKPTLVRDADRVLIAASAICANQLSGRRQCTAS
jgi:sarcosine oxidase subunit beta